MIKNNIVGKVYKSKNYGKFKVLKPIGKDKNGQKYLIEFIKTGYQSSAFKIDIKLGRVKDYYSPSVYGVGYLGDVDYTDRKIYVRWKSMLRRVASELEYKGVSVSDRWLCFANFQKDIKELDGWDSDKFKSGEITLDKDKKQIGKPLNKKIYSKDTCCWLTPKEQANYINTQKMFKAISPKGEIFYGKNQSKFAREHNLCRQGVGNVLNNKRNQYLGWVFDFVE